VLGLYVISFLGGLSVLAFELTSARLIAPFYGNSFIVWTLIITTSLVGLTAGYFAGGALSRRFSSTHGFACVLLSAALLTLWSGVGAAPVMGATLSMGLRWGALAASCLLIVPPLLAMGMISPWLVRLAAQSVGELGRRAGNLYGISTCGSVSGTFLFGFALLPIMGGRGAALTISAVLMVALIIHVVRSNSLAWIPAVVAVLAGAGSFQVFHEAPTVFKKMSPDLNRTQTWTVLDRLDGLYGKLVVVEDDEYRYLVLDGMPQSAMHKELKTTYSMYVHGMTYWAGGLPEGSSALILGLGAGSLVRELELIGFKVEGVEIDPRIVHLARKYFHLSPMASVAIDDGRHFLRVSDKKYDLIVLDCFAGERIPGHLLTLEAFRTVRERLTDRGIVLINYTGYTEGERGYGSRSIARTMKEAGFSVSCFGTGPNEEGRNLIIAGNAASPTEKNRKNGCCEEHLQLIFTNPVDLFKEDAMVLTDDRGELELFNVEYHEFVRRRCLRELPWEIMRED
jgi:spermidine synthase